MLGLYIWLIIGCLSGAYLVFFLGMLFQSTVKPIQEITLGDVLGVFGGIAAGTVFGPITLLIAVGITFDELQLGKLVLWERKETILTLDEENEN